MDSSFLWFRKPPRGKVKETTGLKKKKKLINVCKYNTGSLYRQLMRYAGEKIPYRILLLLTFIRKRAGIYLTSWSLQIR